MTGGIPFGLGFGFGPMPMPGPVDGDPGQMQLDDEQKRNLVARLLGTQMFHPGSGPAAMDAFGDLGQGQDQDPRHASGPGAQPQAPSGPALGSPLASVLGGMPSMNAGQMPPPQMPAPQQDAPQQSAPQQDAPNPAPGQIPSMIGAAFPQMSALGGRQATGAIPQAGPQAALQTPAPASSEDNEAQPASAHAAPAGRAVPQPPVRPSDLSALGGGMRPVDSFDPLTGQPVSGSPRSIRGDFDPLTGQPVAGSPRPVASSAPSDGAAARQGPEPAPGSPAWEKEHPVLATWRRFGESGVGDQLLAFGAGMLQGHSFAEGAGRGIQNMLAVRQSGAAGDMQRLEYALKLQKVQQEQAGQNLTAQRLIQLGEDPENVRAAIGASMAGRPEALQNMLNNRFRKTPDAPSGYRQVDGGGLEAIPGGPQDLGVKRADAQATAAGSMEGGAKPLDRIEAEAKAAAVGANAGKPTDDYNLSPGQVRYSGESNQPIATAAPDKPQNFETETKLRTEFAKGLNTFGDVHDGYGRVIAATRQREANPNGVSPASDISLVFGYMKMLDPGSVVREGEYATAANAAGIPERVRNAYNKAMQGEFLTPDQRQDFLGQAAQLYGTARKTAEGVAGRYRNLAGQYGVDPDRVAYLPDAPTAPTVGRDRMKPAGAQGGAPGDQQQAPNRQEAAQPPQGAPAGARQAPDGNWYVADPRRPGKFLQVQ